jgi:hypothetical protein
LNPKISESGDLKLYYQNISCLHNKLVLFDTLLPIQCFDVLLFNEHWEPEENIKHININNYVLASYFSRRLHVHGGTAIFI